MAEIEIVRNLSQLGPRLKQADGDILVVTGWVSEAGVDFLVRHCPEDVQVKVLVGDLKFYKHPRKPLPPNMQMRHLYSYGKGETLHSKFWVIGDSFAYVGSANLTENGLSQNIETGLTVVDKSIVADLKTDFWRYWKKGHAVKATPASQEKGLLSELLEVVRKFIFGNDKNTKSDPKT